MNRIQAINYLKSSGFSNEQIKAIKGAFTCEDAISRQAVLDVTWEEPSYTDALNVLTEVRDKVKALPSVNPQKPICPSAGIDCEDCPAYEDAISRQAVERIITDHRDSISVGGYWGILERLKKLPQVNPLKKVKLGTLMCGDEFVSRGETYKVDSVFNGIVVCENVKTGRYMYMDMESEVNTEGGENSEND